jgi:plasmid stabilization system protein ParE
MVYSVVFTPEARAQLIALYRYIEIDASPAIAQRFTDAIVNHCERFREFPARSVRRGGVPHPRCVRAARLCIWLASRLHMQLVDF